MASRAKVRGALTSSKQPVLRRRPARTRHVGPGLVGCESQSVKLVAFAGPPRLNCPCSRTTQKSTHAARACVPFRYVLTCLNRIDARPAAADSQARLTKRPINRFVSGAGHDESIGFWGGGRETRRWPTRSSSRAPGGLACAPANEKATGRVALDSKIDDGPPTAKTAARFFEGTNQTPLRSNEGIGLPNRSSREVGATRGRSSVRPIGASTYQHDLALGPPRSS